MLESCRIVLVAPMFGGNVGAAIAGGGLGGVKVCREMILANLVDRSRERCGRRCEGVYYGLSRFIGRLSRILEALALALIGVLFGYVSGENPGPDPANAFRFLISVFPFVCMALGWVLAWRVDLRETLRGPGTSDQVGKETN